MNGDTVLVIFMSVWCAIFVGVTVLAVRQFVRWRRGKRKRLPPPQLTVPVTIYAADEGRRRVTFRAESGDLFSLRVEAAEMRFLPPGTAGELTFRGRAYIGFRQRI